jgi:20S proteasome alpha/beta subunit
MDLPNNYREEDSWCSGGVVHMYDAIGSHERLAVACAAIRREILQPILDRLFQESSQSFRMDPRKTLDSVPSTKTSVATHVTCSVDEAIGLLVHGYRATSEREILVGGSILVVILQFMHPSQSRIPLKH